MLTKARPRIRGTALALVPTPLVTTLSGGAQSDAEGDRTNWRVDTCLRHSKDPSKLHFRCLGSHGGGGWGGGDGREAGAVGGDTTLTSNGTVPGLPGLVHAQDHHPTIPTSPSKSHLHQVDCTSQYFTLKKKKSTFECPFFLSE